MSSAPALTTTELYQFLSDIQHARVRFQRACEATLISGADVTEDALLAYVELITKLDDITARLEPGARVDPDPENLTIQK